LANIELDGPPDIVELLFSQKRAWEEK
jgi:hypothetical protein